jgi:peptidoglycan hydrolase CwlO-like protein
MSLNRIEILIEMNEQEIKNLLSVYQQKVSDLTAQTIALEARLMNSNQLIEALNRKINDLNEEIEKMKKSKKVSKIEEDFS